eukprot:1176686-Prorocentrum_minimum.AAC.2
MACVSEVDTPEGIAAPCRSVCRPSGVKSLKASVPEGIWAGEDAEGGLRHWLHSTDDAMTNQGQQPDFLHLEIPGVFFLHTPCPSTSSEVDPSFGTNPSGFGPACSGTEL